MNNGIKQPQEPSLLEKVALLKHAFDVYVHESQREIAALQARVAHLEGLVGDAYRFPADETARIETLGELIRTSVALDVRGY